MQYITLKTLHDKLVLKTISYLLRQEHSNIKADHAGDLYEAPKPISGEIPDITSELNSVFHVTEVEAKEGIGTPETIAQWKKFSAATNGINSLFFVSVPESCLKTAQESAKFNAIRVDMWIYTSGC